MKTLFCCGTATQTGQGQSGLWRWWFYYRPLKEQFGATHFAVNNDGSVNLPNEAFVKLHDGTKPVDLLKEDQLNLIYWPDSLPRQSQYACPGYYRSVSTLTRLAMEQGFDKIVYIEWDFWVIAEEMMREIARVDHGLIAYWVPFYVFPECNIIVCAKDQFKALKDKSDQLGAKLDMTPETIAEVAFPWTEVRKHRVGDRYPEHTDKLPLNAEYCAQLPNTQVVYKRNLVRLAWEICQQCGGKIDFNAKGVLSCRACHPEQFSSPPE